MTHGTPLPRAPLAEVFFELRWRLSGGPPPVPMLDPNYKLLVGGLFAAFKDAGYPVHEQLDTARVPDEFVPYLIQHRFRASEAGYPLVQVGPGVFSRNDVGAGYSWDTFKPRTAEAVEMLRATYAGELAPISYSLRYVNAVAFDFEHDDAFEFMRKSLKVTVDYPHRLFEDNGVQTRPNTVLLESTHQLDSPRGVVSLKFANGEVFGERKFVWETQVQSTNDDVPPLGEGLEGWLEDAHSVACSSFFTLIEGDLQASFEQPTGG